MKAYNTQINYLKFYKRLTIIIINKTLLDLNMTKNDLFKLYYMNNCTLLLN